METNWINREHKEAVLNKLSKFSPTAEVVYVFAIDSYVGETHQDYVLMVEVETPHKHSEAILARVMLKYGTCEMRVLAGDNPSGFLEERIRRGE